MKILAVLICSVTSVKQMDIFKLTRIVPVCAILLTIAGCSLLKESQDSGGKNLDTFSEIVEDVERDMYQDLVSAYDTITIEEMEEILDLSDGTQRYYFYFGRTTCLYCRKFVIENAEPLDNAQNFYYIDTESFQQNEKSILSEYGIEVVPTILSATSNGSIEKLDIEEFIMSINES